MPLDIHRVMKISLHHDLPPEHIIINPMTPVRDAPYRRPHEIMDSPCHRMLGDQREALLEARDILLTRHFPEGRDAEG